MRGSRRKSSGHGSRRDEKLGGNKSVYTYVCVYMREGGGSREIET